MSKRARIAPQMQTGVPSPPAIIVSLAGNDTRVSLAQARSFRDDLSEAIDELERQLPQFVVREAHAASAKEGSSVLPPDVRRALMSLSLTRGLYFVATEMGFVTTSELEALVHGKSKHASVIRECVKWVKERVE